MISFQIRQDLLGHPGKWYGVSFWKWLKYFQHGLPNRVVLASEGMVEELLTPPPALTVRSPLEAAVPAQHLATALRKVEVALRETAAALPQPDPPPPVSQQPVPQPVVADVVPAPELPKSGDNCKHVNCWGHLKVSPFSRLLVCNSCNRYPDGPDVAALPPTRGDIMLRIDKREPISFAELRDLTRTDAKEATDRLYEVGYRISHFRHCCEWRPTNGRIRKGARRKR